MKQVLYILSVVFLLSSCTAENSSTSPEKSIADITSAEKIFKTPKSALKEKEDNTPKDTINVAKMEFEVESFDFGTVNEGEKVEYIYKFQNVGKVPLTISQARSTCGCTVPVWPTEPIGVGESGEIKVVFNTAGKKGNQEKPVNITANTYPLVTSVKLKGQVAHKEKEAKTVAKQ